MASRGNGFQLFIQTQRQPDDPHSDQHWQPKRLDLRGALKACPVWMLAVYAGLILASAAEAVHILLTMPPILELSSFFNMDSVTLPTVGYAAVYVALEVYFVYRDLIGRSLSRLRLFIPTVVFLAGILMIRGLVL